MLEKMLRVGALMAVALLVNDLIVPAMGYPPMPRGLEYAQRQLARVLPEPTPEPGIRCVPAEQGHVCVSDTGPGWRQDTASR